MHCKAKTFSASSRSPTFPGKPMPLNELAALMKADQEKLTTVVKTAGMALQ